MTDALRRHWPEYLREAAGLGLFMVSAGLFGTVLESALPGDTWTALWVYFTAPPLGMLAAAQTYLWLRGRAAVHCAKMHHQNNKRCIFCASRSASQTEKPLNTNSPTDVISS